MSMTREEVFRLMKNTRSIFFEGVTGNDFLVLINVWNDYITQVKASGEGGDHAIQTWARNKGIKFSELAEAAKERKEVLKNFEGGLPNTEINISPENLQNILLSVATGLVDNVVKNTNGAFTTVLGDAPVNIVNNSSLFGKSPKHFMAGKLVHKEHKDKVDAEYNMEISEEDMRTIVPDNALNSQGRAEDEILADNQPAAENGGGTESELPVVLPEEESLTHNPEASDPSSEPSQSNYSTEPESHTHGDSHNGQSHGFKYNKSHGQFNNTLRFLTFKVNEFIRNLLKKVKILR